MARTPRDTIAGRLKQDRGFTLIELLVVILIIGILAAIALPTFINQKSKANDAAAKALAHTAETAMESYATDHNGGYVGVNAPSDVQAVLPSINISSTNGDAYLSSATGSATDYTIVASSPQSSDDFSIVKAGNTVTRQCSGTGGGCVNGSW